MQFRVLTIHAESSCSRGPELTQTERPSPSLMMIAHCYRPDLCPSLCPRISAEPDPHLVSPVLLTHSQLCHLTGRAHTASSQLSFKLSWRGLAPLQLVSLSQDEENAELRAKCVACYQHYKAGVSAKSAASCTKYEENFKA